MGKILLQNGTVLYWDEYSNKLEVLEKTSVLIEDDEITLIGKALSVHNAEVVDCTNKIISPGFINTHCHMWQTAFRTLAPDIFIAQYFAWLSQYGTATQSFSGEDVYLSTLAGYVEGLNAGVTSYVEHASNNWSKDVVKPGFNAAKDSGARVWWCYDISPREGFTEEDQRQLVDEAEKEKEPLVETGLAFDGYDLSQESEVQRFKDYTLKQNPKVLTTHYLGSPWPVGKTSPALAATAKVQDTKKPVIFSHGGYMTDDDIAALREHDDFLSITPENERSEGHGHPRSHLVLDRAALGTDTNWNISGDINLQARLWLQTVRGRSYEKTLEKGLIPHTNPMSVVDAFLMATRQGGRAVGRDDVGVLNIGAKADVIIVNGESPNMIGWSDPVAALILHANAADIDSVIVGGQFRKRDGKVVMRNHDWAEFRSRFVEMSRRVQKENRIPPTLDDKFMGFGEFGDVEVHKV